MGKIYNRTVNDQSGTKSGPTKRTQAEAEGLRRPRTGTRKELADIAREAAEALDVAGMEKLSATVPALIAKSVRERFSICFVGEFSHGKTTVINQLLDIDSLPVDSLPTTSLLTRITYGKKDGIDVYNNKGEKLKHLPLEPKSWDRLVAIDEQGNPIDNEDRYLINGLRPPA